MTRLDEQIRARLDFPHHRQALLEESGISPQVILDRGYRTVKFKTELERLGFSKAQQLVSALAVPMYYPSGELAYHQIKPDSPRRDEKGKPIKYETPRGTNVCLDVHPSQAAHLKDPSIPLWITEGVKKGDCLVSHGQCAVVLQGVDCWQRSGVPLPEWEEIKLYGRQVIVAFDSDVMTNTRVQRALERLVGFLRGRGASVKVLYLPDAEGGLKQGVDDYLASGKTIGWLAQYIEDGLREDLGEVGKSLAGVMPERVEWLWPRRIPKGKITVLDGDPDNGKSVLTTDICARVTVGEPMPDGTPTEVGGAVILSAEDGEADTIRPRFDAAGGDPTKVVLLGTILEGDEERPFVIPDDLPLLERAIQQVGASIVVIDPLMAFLSGKVNSNRDQDVRRALTVLKRVAERTGAAIVIIRHLNKATGTSPIYRGGGSIGIIGAARSGLLVGRHPQDESLRVLAGQKNNLSLPPESLVYGMETAANGAARIAYKGKTQTTARELLEAPEKVGEGSALEKAKEFIREALESGRKMAAKQMFKDSEAAGIAQATLKRAKRDLRVESVKVGEEWVWHLPKPISTEGDHDGYDAPLDTVDPLDPLGQADVLNMVESAGSGEEDQEDQGDQESLVDKGDLLESNNDSSAEDGLLARAIMLRDEGRVS